MKMINNKNTKDSQYCTYHIFFFEQDVLKYYKFIQSTLIWLTIQLFGSLFVNNLFIFELNYIFLKFRVLMQFFLIS
jgi:hypothetical protein